jgi:hypothetical protein
MWKLFLVNMDVPVYAPVDKTAPVNWPPNSNANSLTIQNEYVFAEFSFSFDTLLRGDWSSQKNCVGEDQNSLTHHGQTDDSVYIMWVLYPIDHHDHTNLQYL